MISTTIIYHRKEDPTRIFEKRIRSSDDLAALEYLTRLEHPGTLVIRNMHDSALDLVSRRCEHCGSELRPEHRVPRPIYPGMLESDSHLWQEIEATGENYRDNFRRTRHG